MDTRTTTNEQSKEPIARQAAIDRLRHERRRCIDEAHAAGVRAGYEFATTAGYNTLAEIRANEAGGSPPLLPEDGEERLAELVQFGELPDDNAARTAFRRGWLEGAFDLLDAAEAE